MYISVRCESDKPDSFTQMTAADSPALDPDSQTEHFFLPDADVLFFLEFLKKQAGQDTN